MSARRAALAIAGLGLLAADPALANRSGISGRTTTGCGGGACHSGGTAPAVELIGPAELEAGGAAEFTLRVSGGQTAAGANISAGGGLLVPVDTTLAPRAGELVHNGDALDYVDGAAEFRFRWEAPDTNGPVDIFAVANSVDGNQIPTGDNWALVSTTVTVGGGAPPEDAGMADAGDAGQTGGGGGDEGCAQAPGLDDSPLPWLVVIGGVLLVTRRRR